MAESYRSRYSNSIIPLQVWFVQFLWILFHEVYSEDLLHSRQIGKPVSSWSTLRTYVLKSLACIKSDNLIWLSVVQTFNYDVNSIIAELPNWISHLIIKLSSRIKHILTKRSNCSSSDLLIAISERINELTSYINFSQLVVNHGGMSNQKPNNRTNSDFDHRRLYLFQHLFEKRHENAVYQRIRHIWVDDDGFKVLESTYLFVDGGIAGNRSVHITQVALDFGGVNVLKNLITCPRNEFQVLYVVSLLLDLFYFLVAHYWLDGCVGIVDDELLNCLVRDLHLRR